MARNASERKRALDKGLVVVYTRLDPDDHAELKRREAISGASIAVQIRILVHNGLRERKIIR